MLAGTSLFTARQGPSCTLQFLMPDSFRGGISPKFAATGWTGCLSSSKQAERVVTSVSSQGVILSWDPVKRPSIFLTLGMGHRLPLMQITLSCARPPLEEIEAMGFTRDAEVEDHLRLFAGRSLSELQGFFIGIQSSPRQTGLSTMLRAWLVRTCENPSNMKQSA